ncbi:RidA family protein [Paraherbaspirillum soli]|uniref:RidA family protein n=1 Tax=Paraherbaspirillum soli TaxID=631222 RepID=A0ABW0M734_9BURK
MSGVSMVGAGKLLNKPAGHYSHAACVGDLVFLSGQLPITPQGIKLTGEPFDVQVSQVFDNLDRVLSACGCTRESLVQVRVYLLDIEHWPHFDQLYAAWLGEHRPARTVVPVPALHYGLELEIEAVATHPAIP